jgi:hypothetical protein
MLSGSWQLDEAAVFAAAQMIDELLAEPFASCPARSIRRIIEGRGHADLSLLCPWRSIAGPNILPTTGQRTSRSD